MRETIIHTDKIYEGRVVNLSVHQVRLPNDALSKREVIKHPGAVAIVALDDQQRVVLVRQYRLPADQILYELPAGTLDPDETPEACAIREMQEETGYKPLTITPMGGIYTAPGYTTEFIHLFFTDSLVPSSLEPDDDEFVEVVSVPLAQALAMIESGEIADGKTVAGLVRVARRMGL